jgi:hypothetical protein
MDIYNYGDLPIHKLPAPPAAREAQPWLRYALRAFWLLRVPAPLKRELREIADVNNISTLDALSYSLDYELFGSACLAAALPEEVGSGYRLLRSLDWLMPTETTFRWTEVRPGAIMRQIDGYVGALSGCNQSGAFAMNMPPYRDAVPTNPMGVPVTWALRQALCDRGDLFDSVARISSVVRPAMVLVTAGEEARVYHLTAFGAARLVRKATYPDALVLTNDWYPEAAYEARLVDWWYALPRQFRQRAVLKDEDMPEGIGRGLISVDKVIY